MHILLHYIKVSDNTMLIFICSDGAVSFFFITKSTLLQFSGGGWRAGGEWVDLCIFVW